MRKKIGTLLMLLFCAISGRADNLGYTDERPLIFTMDSDYPPMEYLDEEGKPSGYDVEFTRRLMARMDIPFTYSPNTWSNVARDLLNGKADLAMMVYSPYRKDITNYSRAVFRLYYQMLYRKDKKIPNGLRSVEGKTIALMRSKPVIDTLNALKANPVVVEDLTQAVKDLSDGKYDAVILYRYQTRYMREKLLLDNLIADDMTLPSREYCYVSNNKALIDAIDVELAEMEQEGIIDEVYRNVRTQFDAFKIPRWVWWLFALMVIGSLLVIIYQQRMARQRLQKEIERATENEARAVKSEELKGIFLSNISHALRTPLNAIIGFSDLLLTTPEESLDKNERQNLLGLINTNGLQLLHLINELMSLSDIEGKDMLFERQVTDVDSEMSAYATEIRMQLKEGVELEVVEPIGGIRGLLDPKLMRTVTMHLLENALQHTKNGKITLTYYVKQGGIYVEVKDTGEGIPEKLKKNIFALLSDKNTYVQDETPGLGLSICKAIIDKIGGEIGAKDNEADGQGTVVWYWVPTEILN